MAGLVDLLLEPLGYPFILRAMVAAMLVGTLCAVVGSFVVLRGMAFFGDALAHAILPGVAIGYLVGGGAWAPLVAGAFVAAILAALGIAGLSRHSGLKEDTAIGIVFAGMFALGIALISARSGTAIDLTHILFGNVLGVGRDDLALTALTAVGVLLVLAALFKELVLVSFDPVQAAALRLPAARLHNLLLVLIAVTIVASLRTVGVALMAAMLITPPATAWLLTRRLSHMLVLAALIGAGSGVAGIYLSYYFAVASGAAIVLVATACFGLALLAAPGRRRLRREG